MSQYIMNFRIRYFYTNISYISEHSSGFPRDCGLRVVPMCPEIMLLTTYRQYYRTWHHSAFYTP